jgi:hypothetical protein
VFLAGFFAAAPSKFSNLSAQIIDRGLHPGRIATELVRSGIQFRLYYGHVSDVWLCET